MSGVDSEALRSLFTPALVLMAWTFGIWGLMYRRRVPAMMRLSSDPQEFIRHPERMNELPERAKWAADNFNHLHEQPVLFYALVGYLALMGDASNGAVALSWLYVALRVVHSIVQVTSNRVRARFGVFVLSSVSLLALLLRATWSLWT